VRREGRITRAQQHALDDLLPQYGLSPDTPFDAAAVFGRNAPCTLEVGFGNGESLAIMGEQAPECDFIGIEVHRPGVGHLLIAIEEHRLSNIRVVCADAVTFISEQIQDQTLDRVLIYFPDPWPKKRHHKRRIVQTDFLDVIATRLKPGGLLHLATDWENYAAYMLETADAHPAFSNQSGAGQYHERPAWRPTTKFEQRGLRLGHNVWDLLYERTDSWPDSAGFDTRNGQVSA
jgi:tRNA (guanine-N7-)-methyltransferase